MRGLEKLTEAKMTECVSSSFAKILVKFGGIFLTILFYLMHFLLKGHKFANNEVTFDTRKIMINDFTNCVNE